MANFPKSLLLGSWAKIQQARDDGPYHFFINQNKNIDSDVIVIRPSQSSIVLTMIRGVQTTKISCPEMLLDIGPKFRLRLNGFIFVNRDLTCLRK